MNSQFPEELKKVAGASFVKEAELMKKHITFRVGGPADLMVCPDTECLPEILRLCRKYEVPYEIIGNGSNLLVGDRGIRGLVIVISKRMGEIQIEGTKITAGAGALLSQIANQAMEAELTGMEFAAGIPGSAGGAVVMNAGAYGGEMKDILSSVTVMDRDGIEKELTVEHLELCDRHSCIPEHEYIVTKVVLQLERGEKEEIRAQMKSLKEKRVEKQPLEYPSAGSTFKRPEGYFAGKLIMDAGLRGYRVGGAQVSEKHCGFVINREEATAADVRQLMQEVSDEVERQFGVKLEPEVKMLGEF